MSKYSFLVSSKEPEYFELSPSLRLQKYGGWLVAEAIEQEEISKVQSQATIRAVQLAKRIAVAKGVEVDEAFTMLQSGNVLSELELLSDFTEETLGMLTDGASVETSNARIATAFMRCRGEGYINGEWQALEDWSMDDTKAFTRELTTKLMEFVVSEQETEAKTAAKKATRRTTPVTPKE